GLPQNPSVARRAVTRESCIRGVVYQGVSVRPGEDEGLDLFEGAHALDGVVDAVERIARGEHRLEVVARGGAAHELQRLPELADVRGLHAEDRGLLAHEERGLHGCERSGELADYGLSAAGAQAVEPLGNRIGRRAE